MSTNELPPDPWIPANDVVTLPRVGQRVVRDGVGTRNHERAQNYLAWGAVFDARRQGMTLRARCEGSADERYRVAVHFDMAGITGASCSCPVGENGACKHTGAVLLDWIEHPGDFLPVLPLESALALLDRDELLTLVRAALTERPEFVPVLESHLPRPLDAHRPAPPVDAWRARASDIFRRHGNTPEAVSAIVTDLTKLAADGVALVQSDNVMGAVALHEQIVSTLIGRYRRFGESAGPLVALAKGHIDALVACARRLTGNRLARDAVLKGALFLYRFDIEHGTVGSHGPGPGRYAATAAAREASRDERSRLASFVRDETERAEEWARRAWSAVLLELEEGAIDDETWIARCRLFKQHGLLARRLVALRRLVEAREEVARVADAELVEVAEALAGAGLGEEAERIVTARAERASEANRAKLTAWLRARAEARRDAAAMVEVNEAVFRAKPDAEGYESLRAQAQAAGVWDALRERLHTFLGERGNPLLLDVLVREKAFDEAVEAARNEHFRGASSQALRLKLAETIEAERPRDAIELYQRHAEGLIQLRGRQNYREACRVAARVLALYEGLGDSDTGAQWFAALRTKYGTLTSLQAEIAARFDGMAA